MKLKLMPILATAITLTGCFASVLSATASPSTAQTPPTAPESMPATGQFPGKPPMANINLTEEQKSQIEQINKDTRTQMENVLTQEQKQQLQSAMKNRKDPRAALANLSLSDAQKTQLQEIMQSAQSQIEAILTEEQREQLQQMRQNMPQPPQQLNQ